MLRLEKVASGYGAIQVLHGIDLHVEQGEVVTLIGSNGAGKTTTLKTICNVLPNTGGRILFEGEDISAMATQEIVRRGVTQVPEGRRLFPEMTVEENLAMGAFLRDDQAAVRRDLEHCFELFPRLRERRRQLARIDGSPRHCDRQQRQCLRLELFLSQPFQDHAGRSHH